MIHKSCPPPLSGLALRFSGLRGLRGGGQDGGGLAAPPPPRVRTGMLALTLVPGWGQGLAARRPKAGRRSSYYPLALFSHARPHPGPRLGPGASGRRPERGPQGAWGEGGQDRPDRRSPACLRFSGILKSCLTLGGGVPSYLRRDSIP